MLSNANSAYELGDNDELEQLIFKHHISLTDMQKDYFRLGT